MQFNHHEKKLLQQMFESEAWKLLTTYAQSRKDTVVRGLTVKSKSLDDIRYEQGRAYEVEHLIDLPQALLRSPPKEKKSDPFDAYSD